MKAAPTPAPRGIVRKTIVLPETLNQQLEAIVRANNGITFSFLLAQAIKEWLNKPQLELNAPARSAHEARVNRGE